MIPSKCEYKYLVPVDRIDALREALLPYTVLDPYAARTGQGEYTVRSVYLDTPDMAAYREKIEGVRARRKYRIRSYNQYDPEAAAFLEIKRKEGSRVSKFRARLALKDLPSLYSNGEGFGGTPQPAPQNVDADGIGMFLGRCRMLRLRPVVLVVYEREPFLGRVQPSLRITLDKNLRGAPAPLPSALFEDGVSFTAMRRHCTLEVKFEHGMPGWLREILFRFGLQRRALSKYTLCYDAITRTPGGLRASLPASAGSGPAAVHEWLFPVH